MSKPRPNNTQLVVPFDGAVFSPLTSTRRLEYSAAWNLYVNIALLQRQIEADRENNKKLAYFTFESYAQRNDFIKGMNLHSKAYPEFDWCSEFEGFV
jgi:hypothetical protein